MNDSKPGDELFQGSQLTLLLSYTIFSLVLIVESLIMGWEKWVLLMIIGGVVISWVLHIRHTTPGEVRIWIYAILMMFTFFFYGTHLTSHVGSDRSLYDDRKKTAHHSGTMHILCNARLRDNQYGSGS